MDSWNNRLNKALNESGMTPAEFARAVKTSTASVSEWLGGITKELKASNSERICAVLGINHRWLVTGRGPMKQLPRPIQVAESTPEYPGLPPKAVELAKAAAELSEEAQAEMLNYIKFRKSQDV